MNTIWLYFPLCLVTSLVLAASREDGAGKTIVKGLQTFVAFTVAVAIGCGVLWTIQWKQPSKQAFLIGVGALVLFFWALHYVLNTQAFLRLGGRVAATLHANGVLPGVKTPGGPAGAAPGGSTPADRAAGSP